MHGTAGSPSVAAADYDPAPMRLYALRGAISVDRNEAAAIRAQTERLVGEILERNALGAADLVSCLFTVTPDLNADFPATAARGLGLDGVPLICAQEIDVPGALPRVIRVLVHYHAADGHEPRHVYLDEAASLRTDLAAAQ
jgi:chorismate mutase